MALKGHTKIELTNVHTGQKEVVEHHNMITNVMQDMNKRVYGVNGMETDLYLFAKQFGDPFWKAMFSGIILFEDALTDDPSEYIFPAGNKVVGCGDIERVRTSDFSDKSCSVMGNYNSDESVATGSTIKMVYDFPTSQGNGTISAIALCNKLLARSCYVYSRDYMSATGLRNGLLGLTKNTASSNDHPEISNDGNVYTISYYYHDTEDLKIKLSSRLNYNAFLFTDKKTISIELDASDYAYKFLLGDANIMVLYSSTTKKFKYICLIDGSVYERNIPQGYDYIVPFIGYYVCVKKKDSLYYYSVLKDDGTVLHEDIYSSGSILPFAKGMYDNRYVLCHDGAIGFLFDLETGGVSRLFINVSTNNASYNMSYNGELFCNILHTGVYINSYTAHTGYLPWRPCLTTKNNLETPVTKTSDKTMKVTYTLTEA